MRHHVRAIALLLPLLAAVPVTAQVRVFAGPAGGSSSALILAERALRMKAELKLTDAQVAQLETVRKEEVAREQELSSRMIQLHSDLRTGRVEWEAVRDSLENNDDARRDQSRAARDRARKILTEDQLDELEESWTRYDGMIVRPGLMSPSYWRYPEAGRRFEELQELGLRPGGRRFYRFDDPDGELFNFNFETPDMSDFHFEVPDMSDFHFNMPDLADWHFEMPDMSDFHFNMPDMSDWHFEMPDMSGFRFEMPDMSNFRFETPVLPRFGPDSFQFFDWSGDGKRKEVRRGTF